MRFVHLATTVFALGVLCNVGLLSAAAPLLERLEPRGGQAGTAVKLTLIGEGLDSEVRLDSAIPGALTALAPPKKAARIGKEVSFILEISPDALVGPYTLRASSRDGMSNILLFTVGAFTETEDRELNARGRLAGEPLNDSLSMAQPVEAPVTINGTLTVADRDFFRFHAAKGQNLIIEAEARRIGSAVDPAIELFDTSGNRIGRNQDAPGIGVDSRLAFTAPADGDYIVALRDSKFSKQTQNYYRLKIANYGYAESLFPLGGRRGETLEVEMFGGNLDKPVKTQVDLTTKDPAAEFVDVRLPGAPGALPMRVAVSDDPEADEPTGAEVKELKPGTLTNGRIAKAGEADRYRFAVESGQKWHIELQAAKLGTSQLYGVLNLFDGKGERLGTTREIGLRFKLSNLDVGEDPNADQHMSFEVPEDVNEIQVEIEDLLGRGGDAFGYRILAAERPGDFTMTIQAEQLNVPLRGSAFVAILINRLNYYGSIELSIPNLPDDWTMNGGNIPALEQQGARRAISTGILTVTPKPGAETRSVNLEIWGEGEVDGEAIRRRARGPGMKSNVSFRVGEVTSNENVAPWLGADLPAVVTEERAAGIEFNAPHYIKIMQATKAEIPFEFTARQEDVVRTDKPDRTNLILTSGVRVTRRLIVDEDNPNKGVFILGGQVGWGPGLFEVVLPAKIKVDGREETVYAQAITIDVVRPYEIEPLTEITALEPGSETTLAVRLNRQLGFDREVEIKAENLPLGISCESAKIPGSADEFQLPCKVESSAEAGEYEIDLTTSSTVIGGEDKVIPFSPPPFKVKVKIATGSHQPEQVADGL